MTTNSRLSLVITVLGSLIQVVMGALAGLIMTGIIRTPIKPAITFWIFVIVAEITTLLFLYAQRHKIFGSLISGGVMLLLSSATFVTVMTLQVGSFSPVWPVLIIIFTSVGVGNGAIIYGLNNIKVLPDLPDSPSPTSPAAPPLPPEDPKKP